MVPMRQGFRNILLPVFFLFLSTGKDWAEPAKVGAMSDTQLLALAESWAGSVGGNHPDQLEMILDENYEHIHGTGLQENREQFLAALRSGARKYKPIRLEELRVRVLGNVALVTGKFSLQVEARGKVIEGTNRFCMTMIERPEGWKILQFQATALMAKP
ncbi:MAG: nuclear transport factor 2 family protein [Verrucomicrobia bacterium]|nr:nuclear transport factor 2 family protein [Verrucomicrobiota bacterium]